MGVHLQLASKNSNQQQPLSSAESIIKKNCYKCKKLVPLSDMRFHIGRHILRNEIVGLNICGFCGRHLLNNSEENIKKRFKTIFWN